MGSPLPRRKVLIVEDELSIRNALQVLLTGLGCDGDVAGGSLHTLSMLRRNRFDALLLDLRCSSPSHKERGSDLRKIRPSLVGRVLVITGEVADPQTLTTLEHWALSHVPRHRVVSALWSRLRGQLELA